MKLLLAAFGLAAGLYGQDPAGVIEGSVVDSVSRQPVAGAEVLLRGRTGGTATTDGSGSFRFEKLPADVYRLETTAVGYLDFRHGHSAERVVLKSGDAAERVAIELVPLGDVEGRTLDEEGDAAPGVTVEIGPSVRAISDAEGRYRLENLTPGEYRIALHAPVEMRRRTLKRDPDSGETFGYAGTQFYPDAYDERSAIAVAVGPGVHLRRFDLRLRRTRLVTVSGRLVETGGRELAEGAAVELSSSFGAGIRENYRQPAGAQGKFQFELIRPGTHSLLVYRGPMDVYPCVTSIEVGSSGTENLTIAVPRFSAIQGTMKAADPKMRWEGTANVNLVGGFGIRGRPVAVSGDGSFTIENVAPGQWRVDVQASGLRQSAEPHHRLYVAAVRFGQQDGLWAPVTVTESGNPALEITLSDEVGQLAGNIADAGGGILVIVRRTDGPYNLSQFVAPRYSNDDGSFLVPDLIPGEYEVSAWAQDPSGNTVTGPPERCGDRLARVKITTGETSLARIGVCNR